LSLRPRLLIADEPTTAVDVTVQAQVLRMLRDRCRELNTSLILVTHDLGVIAQIADRVAVMYAGQIVEEAPVAQLFAHPRHPYTRGLMHSIPRLGEHKARLAEIPGIVPSLMRALAGCRFASRCPERLARCADEPPPSVEVDARHVARCW